MTTEVPRGSRSQQGRGRAAASNARPSAAAQPSPQPTTAIPSPATRGKGKGRGRGKGGGQLATKSQPTVAPRLPNIVWNEDRVKALVDYLVAMPADRHVLFHDYYPSGSAPPRPEGKPSGLGRKRDVHNAIAKHIFEKTDPNFAVKPDKYAKSVSNRLTALRNDYRDHRKSLCQTGAGVHPDDPQPNLHAKIRDEFPYYDQLDEFWRSIPGIDSDLASADPTEDHAQSMLSIACTQPGNDIPVLPVDEYTNAGEELLDDIDEGANLDNADGADMEVDEGDWQTNQPKGFEDDVMASDDDFGPIVSASVVNDTMPSTIPSGTITVADANFGSPTTMSAKAAGKRKPPSWDSRAAFRQQTAPYPRPSSSRTSSTSLPSTSTAAGPSGSATKANSASARFKNELQERLSDFTRESESRQEEDSQKTRRYVARLNYATRDKELELERERLANHRATADLDHRRELDRMQKDIDLKNAEENCFARQVEMLQLQIRLAEMQQSGASSSNAPQP